MTIEGARAQASRTMPHVTPEDRRPPALPAALTIGGSDSSAGAGIQADLKTFAALGVYGASAVTCLTAQNPGGVHDVRCAEAEFVRAQIRMVCEAFPIVAAKTGMLHEADVIRAVAMADVRQGLPILVVDPVMVAASGARLMSENAVDVLCSELLPHARLITPNIPEAEILCGHAIGDLEEMADAAREIGEQYDTACVIKGGNLAGEDVVDFLYDEGEEHTYRSHRVSAHSTHGAGCGFSAAITAYLARGELLHEAVGKARDFVRRAIERARPVGEQWPLNFTHAGDAAIG